MVSRLLEAAMVYTHNRERKSRSVYLGVRPKVTHMKFAGCTYFVPLTWSKVVGSIPMGFVSF